MSDLEKHFLEAVPADAGRILVVGKGLIAHRALWEVRHPLATIDSPNGPWTRPIPAEKGPKADAAILSLDDLGDDATAAVGRIVNCLAPGATLALFTAAGDLDAALAPFGPLLRERGLKFDRHIGSNSPRPHRLVRFHFTEFDAPRMRIVGDPMALFDEPLSQSLVRVRLREPCQFLNTLPGVRSEVVAPNEWPSVPDPETTKIVLIQRKYFHPPDRLVQRARAQNYLTVHEVDDMFVEGEGVDFEVYRSNLIRYHALQTTTPAMADHLRAFHSEVAIFPNQLARIRPLKPREPSASVRIILAASRRRESWRLFINAYREVVAGFGDRVTTVVIGDREFYEALGGGKRVFLPAIPYPAYVAELEKSDIALLPLADNSFDRGKSDLKFIECAEAGAVVLASQTVYGETVKPGKTGFVYRNVDEFRRHLSTLIAEPSTRAKVQRHAHRFVSERRALATHVRRQYEWYLSLVARREELERALHQRIGQA